GRLAEVLGPVTIGIDRGMRLLGLYRVAEAEVELLGLESRAELEAYAAGVNACLASQPLPVEFSLLRYRPEPWKPADSLCWAKMMAWALSINWDTELLRARLAEVLGPERAAELEPLLPGPVVTGGESLGTTPYASSQGAYSARRPAVQPSTGEEEPEADLRSTGGTPGSNNWVIAGSRTTTGKPLLASDMHLLLSAPAIWYENHLACSGSNGSLDVTGVSFPGIPYVIAGHNGRVAWGFTNGYPDVQDLFVERLRRSPHGIEYEHQGRWQPAEVRREEIRVRDAAAVVQEVIVTVHGPIINQLAPGLASQPGSDGLPEQPLALCWTALEPSPMVTALRSMNRAGSCSEFREATRGWIVPAQNTVYADIQGNIGYSFSGRVPIRPHGDGRVPVPGWTGDYDWSGWIPFEELPHQENPPQGFIVSANNRPVDDDYPYYIGREFAMADRAERITSLIRGNSKLSVSDMRSMQLDQRPTSLQRLVRRLGELEVAEPDLKGLVTLVKAWDGELTADSAAGAVCEILARLVQKEVMEAKLGQAGAAADGGAPLVERVLGRGPIRGLQDYTFFYHRLWEWLYWALEQPDLHWWDLGHGETRDDVLRIALRRTYNYLAQRLGEPELPGYGNWAWGRLHTVTFAHVAGQAPAVSRHFNRGAFPVGGDENTISASGAGVTPDLSTTVVGPPFRFIADLSDLSRCYGLLAPGNSGRPASPHYDDQIEAWLKGKYHRMLYKREDVEQGARRRLTLTPRQSP
ncbi:MAG: penicillin acylase family protein, partial [Nitrososphaerales archaeon]